MANTPFPVPNASLPYWRTEIHDLDSHRTTEELPSETDIVIIGAGYAGASIAYHLLEKARSLAAKPSIVILEAREACSGATGRNGGHLKPDPFLRAYTVLDTHGRDAAEEVVAFEARQLAEIADIVEQEQIDCDFVRTRASDVFLYQEGADHLKMQIEKLNKVGISTVRDVHYSSGKAAEEVSGVKGAEGVFTYTTGHLWPYKLVLHLLAKAVSSGVNLQTHTPVKQVSSQADTAGFQTVTTSRGPIRARAVVFANNAYTSALLPEFREKIVPVRGVCSRIVSSKSNPPSLSNSYVLHFNNWEYDYLIQRTDGSIVVGGARRAFHKDLSNWFDVYDDSKVIEPAAKYFDGYMQRNFHGWEDSDARTDKVWSGIMGYTSDGFPYVGDMPGKPGQYICAGFNGHGMSQIFFSAKAVAAMIIGGKKIEETDLPILYRSSQERLDSKEQHATLRNFEALKQEIGSAL